MQYFDENNEAVNVQQFKSELKNLQDQPVPTEGELENELEAAYQQANMNVTGMAEADISFSGFGGKLLKKIKQAVCAVVGPNSSADEILDAILDALVALIPGGVLLKPLAKKLAKFIFDKGIGAFCTVS